MRACAFLMAIFALIGAAATAEEPKPSPVNAGLRDEQHAQRTQRFVTVAGQYKLFADNEQKSELDRVKDPVLRWSNPLRETDDGALFLWTQGGRPAAVLCLYAYGENDLGKEFQSLAMKPILATHGDAAVWHPKVAGLAFQKMPGSPEGPAARAALRLRQMRELAREFSASVGRYQWRDELRLLTQPLYRYADEAGEVIDGAVFAFCQGTDPELLLLVEAVQPKEKPARWQFAAARMNMGNLELKHRDEVVWTIDNWNRQSDPSAPYITIVDKVQP